MLKVAQEQSLCDDNCKCCLRLLSDVKNNGHCLRSPIVTDFLLSRVDFGALLCLRWAVADVRLT